MWGDSGHHWFVPDLHDVHANPGQRLQWRLEIRPRFGSNSPDLEHHLLKCLSDVTALVDEKSLIKSAGLNLDLGDVNAEFFERRNC